MEMHCRGGSPDPLPEHTTWPLELPAHPKHSVILGLQLAWYLQEAGPECHSGGQHCSSAGQCCFHLLAGRRKQVQQTHRSHLHAACSASLLNAGGHLQHLAAARVSVRARSLQLWPKGNCSSFSLIASDIS